MAAGRTVAAARDRGLDPDPLVVTLLYGLADELDRLERTGDDRYLRPQLVARALDVMRAGRLLDGPRGGDADDGDAWAALGAELAAALGNAPQP